jgi:hypothetical protein
MYVIAHINCALKVRDYAGWIDVDRTQGSTAQSMADAVEEAGGGCAIPAQERPGAGDGGRGNSLNG